MYVSGPAQSFSEKFSSLQVQATVLCVCTGGHEGHILLSVDDLLHVYCKPEIKLFLKYKYVLQMSSKHKKNGLSAGLLACTRHLLHACAME